MRRQRFRKGLHARARVEQQEKALFPKLPGSYTLPTPGSPVKPAR
jgi:hypothetical protein